MAINVPNPVPILGRYHRAQVCSTKAKINQGDILPIMYSVSGLRRTTTSSTSPTPSIFVPRRVNSVVDGLICSLFLALLLAFWLVVPALLESGGAA